MGSFPKTLIELHLLQLLQLLKTKETYHQYYKNSLLKVALQYSVCSLLQKPVKGKKP